MTAGTYEITASAGNDQPSDAQTITFVADKATATVSGIEVIGNYALADGKAKQTYKVTVTDANNNLLKDSEVTLTASPANLALDPDGTAKTNEQGQAIFTATTTVAAKYTLTAQVSQTNGQVSTKTAESKFVADDKTRSSPHHLMCNRWWRMGNRLRSWRLPCSRQITLLGMCGSTLRLRKE